MEPSKSVRISHDPIPSGQLTFFRCIICKVFFEKMEQFLAHKKDKHSTTLSTGYVHTF